VIGHVDAVGAGCSTDARDVVGVVRCQRVFDQTPVWRVDNAELIAAVGGGEHAVVALGQAELAVELLRCVDVGYPKRHVGKTVQGHRITPSSYPIAQYIGTKSFYFQMFDMSRKFRYCV
jgi:Zn ribbon nucleic-acid-binding protein